MHLNSDMRSGLLQFIQGMRQIMRQPSTIRTALGFQSIYVLRARVMSIFTSGWTARALANRHKPAARLASHPYDSPEGRAIGAEEVALQLVSERFGVLQPGRDIPQPRRHDRRGSPGTADCALPATGVDRPEGEQTERVPPCCTIVCYSPQVGPLMPDMVVAGTLNRGENPSKQPAAATGRLVQ